ncbi:9844_t:CDS:1, partial [Funneliformis mosseae]
TVQQTLLDFLSTNIKDTITNKRKFENIISSDSENNDDEDTESDDN